MELERMKRLKDSLMTCVETQVNGNLKEVDAKELGEAIDMIKDFSEAIYYCTITKAMEEEDEYEEKGHNSNGKHGTYYYNPRMVPQYPIEYLDPRYRERYNNPMYNYPMYASNNGSGSSSGNSSNGGSNANYREGYIPMYHHPMEERYPMEYPYHDGMKDLREGRSPDRRRRYMEGKEKKHDKVKQMQELENYMQELTSDLTEMIEDASPEEKQLLQQKISTLATKIK